MKFQLFAGISCRRMCCVLLHFPLYVSAISPGTLACAARTKARSMLPVYMSLQCNKIQNTEECSTLSYGEKATCKPYLWKTKLLPNNHVQVCNHETGWFSCL